MEADINAFHRQLDSQLAFLNQLVKQNYDVAQVVAYSQYRIEHEKWVWTLIGIATGLAVGIVAAVISTLGFLGKL